MSQPFTCGDSDALVSYLYNEAGPDERAAVDAHLAVCPACAREVEELQAVRHDLAEWSTPARVPAFRLVETAEQEVARRARWRIPVWAQAAAAVLVLSVGAGLANLEIWFGSGGVRVRTGWQHAAVSGPVASTPAADAADAPWRAALADLERRLRQDFEATAVRATAASTSRGGAVEPSMNSAQLLAQFKAMLEDSERRQRRELALRVAELQRDFAGQRGADLLRIQQGLRQFEARTGLEVAQQRQTLQYLMRVSQQIK